MKKYGVKLYFRVYYNRKSTTTIKTVIVTKEVTDREKKLMQLTNSIYSFEILNKNTHIFIIYNERYRTHTNIKKYI